MVLLSVESIEGTVHVDTAQYPAGQLFAVRAHGDGMTGAGILATSPSFVHSRWLSQGIVVALVRGEDATIKRYRPRGKEVRPGAENPLYEPIVRTAREVEIRGKVSASRGSSTTSRQKHTGDTEIPPSTSRTCKTS